MSWIHHDTAIEGTVYTVQELRAAIDPMFQADIDSGMQPVIEEIRRHREALDFIRDQAVRRRQPITVDLVKRIYLILHPEEGDVKTVKYRKDIPQHRLYFHEYAPPDKITYKVRQIIDWVNDPETRRTRTPVRLAARAHYDLLRVFPFAHGQRQGRAPPHEPAPSPRGLPAGDHPLDGAAALLRGAQGLERDHESIVQESRSTTTSTLDREDARASMGNDAGHKRDESR